MASQSFFGQVYNLVDEVSATVTWPAFAVAVIIVSILSIKTIRNIIGVAIDVDLGWGSR